MAPVHHNGFKNKKGGLMSSNRPVIMNIAPEDFRAVVCLATMAMDHGPNVPIGTAVANCLPLTVKRLRGLLVLAEGARQIGDKLSLARIWVRLARGIEDMTNPPPTTGPVAEKMLQLKKTFDADPSLEGFDAIAEIVIKS
jgi:hypothetical protein